MRQHDELAKALRLILGREVKVEKVQAVGGGSISRAYAIHSNAGNFFLKANDAQFSRAMFEAEEDGLRTLREASRFGIPRVHGVAEHKGMTYLLMALLTSGVRNPD